MVVNVSYCSIHRTRNVFVSVHTIKIEVESYVSKSVTYSVAHYLSIRVWINVDK